MTSRIHVRIRSLALVAALLAPMGADAKGPSRLSDPNLSANSSFRQALVKGGKLCDKMLKQSGRDSGSVDLASSAPATFGKPAKKGGKVD